MFDTEEYSEVISNEDANSNPTDDQQVQLHGFGSLDFSQRGTVYEQVEQLFQERSDFLTPIAMSMNYYNSIFSKYPIPDPGSISIQRVPSLSDRGGLWLVDTTRDVITVALIAQISQHPNDLKASARIFFNEVRAPQGCTSEVTSIYDEHTSRFQSLLNCLQEVTCNYLDLVKPSDNINMSTFVELHDLGHYGLQGKTANIFQNVPSRKTKQSSTMMNVRGKLPDPTKLRATEKQKNLRALATEQDVDAVDVTKRVLGHWPDPDGLIRSLAEKHDLSGVRMHIPEVYDAQGSLVHPMDYDKILICGLVVAVEFNFHVWDITKSSSGKPVNKPNRICSNIIRKLSVLPADEDDVRVMLHSEGLKRADELQRRAKEMQIVEEARELARREELLRLEQTMAKAKLVADTKKRRLDELRSQAVKPSTNALPMKRGSPESSKNTRPLKRGQFTEHIVGEPREDGEIVRRFLQLNEFADFLVSDDCFGNDKSRVIRKGTMHVPRFGIGVGTTVQIMMYLNYGQGFCTEQTKPLREGTENNTTTLAYNEEQAG
ncbi:hypothetical protein C8R41DRAFT_864401 [Lentinula lateritia]|uniref:Uncharacterized protein n=1 Tax=Lentinula lateritia TaxID=40482 RepID=A0ABQ8VWG8_9AGAR|nr:hypothetical protein C8R41DRAFT_864401 [Lentinula lateritia]